MPDKSLLYFGSASPQQASQNGLSPVPGTLPDPLFLVLRALFVNITSALEVKNVAQGIVDAYVKELDIPTAFVMLVDNPGNVVRPCAIAHADSTVSLSRLFGKPFTEVAIPLDYQSNIMVQALHGNSEQETGNILDVFAPEISQEVADRISKLCSIRSVIIVPLTIGTRSLGALCVGVGFHDAELRERPHTCYGRQPALPAVKDQ